MGDVTTPPTTNFSQCEAGECCFGTAPCPNQAQHQVPVTDADGQTYIVQLCPDCEAEFCPTSVTGEHLWVNYGGNAYTDVACFVCFKPQPPTQEN